MATVVRTITTCDTCGVQHEGPLRENGWISCLYEGRIVMQDFPASSYSSLGQFCSIQCLETKLRERFKFNECPVGEE